MKEVYVNCKIKRDLPYSPTAPRDHMRLPSACATSVFTAEM